MNALEELQQTAARLKREMYEPYAFADEHEPWLARLRELEQQHHGARTSKLWRAFLAYDEARTAYQAAYAQRQRWQQELSALGQQLVEQADPDSSSDEAWSRAYLRGRRLEQAIKDPHNLLAELEGTMQRTEEAWGRAWHGYQVRRQERARQAQRVDLSATERWQVVQRLDQEIADYETPRGG